MPGVINGELLVRSRYGHGSRVLRRSRRQASGWLLAHWDPNGWSVLLSLPPPLHGVCPFCHLTETGLQTWPAHSAEPHLERPRRQYGLRLRQGHGGQVESFQLRSAEDGAHLQRVRSQGSFAAQDGQSGRWMHSCYSRHILLHGRLVFMRHVSFFFRFSRRRGRERHQKCVFFFTPST